MDFKAQTGLLGLTKDELRAICKELKLPAFKGDILFGWLQQGVVDYNAMTNLSRKDREQLAALYPLSLPQIIKEQVSKDGTTAKLLLDYGLDYGTDDNDNPQRVQIELVIMLYNRRESRNRHTLCISTQAGCAMGCAFCATGLSGLHRNLTAGEIVAQVLTGKLWLNQHGLGEITNLVYMGMGEPFANYQQVMQSLRIINHPDGLNIGQRRVTVSTCGLVPQIKRFADEDAEFGLAISLHAPDDELRSRLMPVNRRYGLADLMAACDYYTAKTNRRISYEYALLQGINDGKEQAQALAELLGGRLAHVNLIPVNFVEETGFLPSPAETLNEFASILNSRGIETTVREKRGSDIDGACGQLRRNHNR